jgi:hypothetical protein
MKERRSLGVRTGPSLSVFQKTPAAGVCPKFGLTAIFLGKEGLQRLIV